MSDKNRFSDSSAKSYSQALYELAFEEKNLSDVEKNVISLLKLISQSGDFNSLIKDPTNKQEDQLNVINIIFEKFNLNKFTSISGKTGVYVQYAQVRAKRLLEKSQIVDTNGELMIANEEERSLIVALLNLEFYINQSTKFNEPHHLANYLYDISNLFNNFYQGENILSVENEEVKKSKLLITKYFLQNSNLVMSCLGINPVNKM